MDRLTSAIPSQGSPDKRKQRHIEGTWITDPSKARESRRDNSSFESGHLHPQAPLRVKETSKEQGERSTTLAMNTTYSSADDSAAHRHILRSRSRSPAKRSRSPSKKPSTIPHSSSTHLSLAARREVLPPTPLDTDKAREYQPESARKPQVAQPPFTPSPRRSPVRPTSGITNDSSSLYSQDGMYGEDMPPVSPLRISKEQDLGTDTGELRSYNEWVRSTASPEHLLRRDLKQSQHPNNRGIPKTNTTGDLHDEGGSLVRTWSPLSDYLTSRDIPVRKEMVGTRGWLERTTDSSNKKPSPVKKTPQTRKVGLLDSLKKIAKDIKDARKPRDSEKEYRSARLTVSLDPREQSLLYCELEFLLTIALESYITTQFNSGRLDADKYKRVVDGWQQKGRPKVVGFRYDLETQLELVHLHITDFRFYGRRAGLTVAVNGLLEMMKVNARSLRIRTFCQPDTVIAKQLLDSQSLLNMIGCSESQQIQLAEVIRFFKIVLEREHAFHRKREALEDSPTHRDTGHWDESQELGGGQGANARSEKHQSSGGDQLQDYGA